ncbi:MAG TPA: type II secretion system protein GspL [Allosphingosinicella sp.]|nr:type II secretion system protein GspL [Allosphingosinicella sp.]
MQTSPTEPPAGLVISFAGGGWLLLEGGAVTARGGAEDEIVAGPGIGTALAVPGAEVAIHWLDLAEGLAPAQAAAAARLMLADASALPVADMHVAVGRPERGLTPVALVPAARMAEWVASDPDLIIPSPLLLLPPAEGLARRDAGAVPDYRGAAAAFSVEPELAQLLAGDAPVILVDEELFEAGLGEALAVPVLNLRQGAFARRRQWKVDQGSVRRAGLLFLALVAATLLLQVATIMRYAFAADRLEAEAARIGASAPAAAEARPGFASLASILFDSVRAIPNVELTRIDYRPDGSLSAIVQYDSPATFAIFRRHIEASGVAVEAGAAQGGASRPSTELVLRPA